MTHELRKVGFEDLKLNQFVLEGIRVGTATINVGLAGGKLTAETKDLKGYGGGGMMTLVLDASGAVPAHRLNLSVAGLDAYPFLDDAADFQTIEGKAAIALGLVATQRAHLGLEPQRYSEVRVYRWRTTRSQRGQHAAQPDHGDSHGLAIPARLGDNVQQA